MERNFTTHRTRRFRIRKLSPLWYLTRVFTMMAALLYPAMMAWAVLNL